VSGQHRRRTPPEPQGTAPAAAEERSQQIFYDHLRQRGQLIDVDEGADLRSLPPSVTHVKYPDGRIERRGFA